MSKAARTVNIVVFCVWIFLIALALYKEYTGRPMGKTQALKGSISKVTHWYDIYLGKKKIGFASYTFEWVGDEIIIRYRREFKVRVGDAEKVLVQDMKCLAAPSYAVKSFEYSSHMKDEKGLRVTGQVDAGEIIFFLESPEKRKTYKTATKEKDFYFPATFVAAVVLKNPAAGSVFTLPVLDMESLSLKDVKVVVEEIRPIKAGIGVVTLYRIRAQDTVWWCSEAGIILKEESPLGITLYYQVEKIAKDPSDRVLFDYTALPFFKSDKLMQNTEQLKKLKVRIGGFPLSQNLYKKSTVTIKGNILTVHKVEPEEIKKSSYPLPYKNAMLDQYLTADAWVMSDHKTVRGNALNMAGIEKNDAFPFARYLNANLYLTVKTMPVFVLTSTMDIFELKVGEYLQRTVMFASFARAAGLPTRLVGGLVYRNGYFYFHTWPEVWFDKWIPMEPTLAQFPADVTHIPLKEGTLKDITSIVDDLRSLTIEVLEAA